MRQMRNVYIEFWEEVVNQFICAEVSKQKKGKQKFKMYFI
jgi:hypothetical protein